jgi:hypothetical protein
VILTLAANDRRAVGEQRNGIVENVIAGLAILVLLAMSAFRLMR